MKSKHGFRDVISSHIACASLMGITRAIETKSPFLNAIENFRCDHSHRNIYHDCESHDAATADFVSLIIRRMIASHPEILSEKYIAGRILTNILGIEVSVTKTDDVSRNRYACPDQKILFDILVSHYHGDVYILCCVKIDNCLGASGPVLVEKRSYTRRSVDIFSVYYSPRVLIDWSICADMTQEKFDDVKNQLTILL